MNSVTASSYAAVKLQDGRVLIVGCICQRTGKSFAEIYDPKINEFKLLKINNEYRTSNPSVVLLNDGRVFVISGNNAEIFDPKTDSFKVIDTIRAKDNRFDKLFITDAVLLDDGRVFILDALKNRNPDNATIFDPNTETFKSVGGALYPLYGRTLTKLQDGRVLIMGGTRSWFDKKVYKEIYNTEFKDAEIFDPKTETFSYTGNLKRLNEQYSVMRNESILLSNGKVLVAGGSWSRENPSQDDYSRHGDDNSTSMQLYNPISGEFELMSLKCLKPSCWGRSHMLDMGNNRIFILNFDGAYLYEY